MAFTTTVVELLNANQGFIMAILTLVYVLTTAVIAVIGYRANKLSRLHLEVAVELDRRRTRPYVVFDIVSKSGLTHAVLKNVGLSAAYDVKVTITPKLVSTFRGPERDCGLTTHMIAFLAPGREIADFLNQSPAFLKKYEIPAFEGSVDYNDADQIRHSERFRIDLTFHRDIHYLVPKESADEIARIGDALRDIAGKMKS